MCKDYEQEICQPVETRICEKCERKMETVCEDSTVEECKMMPKEVCVDKVTNVTTYETVPVCKTVKVNEMCFLADTQQIGFMVNCIVQRSAKVLVRGLVKFVPAS